MHALLTTLVLSLAAAPPDWGARVSIEGEASAGALADQGDSGAASGAQTDWVPGVDVDLALRRQHLVAGYHPRIGLRWPAVADGRPVVLHRLSLRYTSRLLRRLQLDSSAFLDAGEVHYGRSLFVFDGSALSSSVPDVDVLSFLSSGADATLRWQLDRRQALRLAATVGINRPLDDATTPAAFPAQLRNTLTAGYRLTASRRDDLDLELQGRWQTFDPGPSYLTLRPTLQWRRRLLPSWNGSLRGGALLASQQGSSPAGAARALPAQPVAELTLDGAGRLAARLPGRLNLSAGLDGYYDPVAATLAPQASLRSQVEVAWGAHALASAQAYVYIPLGSEDGAATLWGWRESVLAGGDVRIVPWLDRNLRLELGLRGFSRWAAAGNPSVQRREMVAFVGLRAGVDAR